MVKPQRKKLNTEKLINGIKVRIFIIEKNKKKYLQSAPEMQEAKRHVVYSPVLHPAVVFEFSLNTSEGLLFIYIYIYIYSSGNNDLICKVHYMCRRCVKHPTHTHNSLLLIFEVFFC